MQKMGDYESPYWQDDQISFMPDIDSPKQISHPCKQEVDHHLHFPMFDNDAFAPQQRPELTSNVPSCSYDLQRPNAPSPSTQTFSHALDYQLMDWRAMDRYVASQLSIDRDNHGRDQEANYSEEGTKYASEWTDGMGIPSAD